jgi:L-malate glycosyltransferase
VSEPKKINVLVIPDLFPKFEGDVQGIFILDYLKTTATHCRNMVLFGRLRGERTYSIEKTSTATIHRFSVSTKKHSVFIKPFLYILWFIKGYNIGKQLTETEIIHAHGSILSGTLSYLLSKKLNVPFIITEHQGPFTMTSENFWKRNWTRFIMQKANVVLTVSEHLKQEILNTNIHPKSIIVTHNPVDTELFKLRESSNFKNILFVGRLDNFKGALRCLTAFEKIHDQYPDWLFTIVGDGEDMLAIKQYIENNPALKNKITLKGQLSKANIAKEMQTASFLVFPSRHESFGLVIAEALSCGLPVIVGNLTAPKEFVKDSFGILIPPDDIQAISGAMLHLISNYTTYPSEAIRASIHDNFGFESFEKKLTNIYQSQLNKC